jgi:hypothetical protein
MSTFLDEIESIDGYRNACLSNPANATARRGHQYTLFDLSPESETAIRRACNSVEMLKDVMIVVLHPSADNGFPHTRPLDCVCIHPAIVQKNLKETLIHESIHIHQRRNPSLWDSVCRKEGWEPCRAVPPRWVEQCRINPDTMLCPFWAWEGFHVPLPLFRSKTPSGLGDVTVQWWDRRMGSLFKEPPMSFQNRYGANPQPEHPFEVLAVEAANEGIQKESELLTFLRTL